MALNNLEYIKALSIEDLAKLLLKPVQQPQYDYDWDENPYFSGMEDFLETSDGILYDVNDREEAIQHEIEWLKKKFDPKYWKEQLK